MDQAPKIVARFPEMDALRGIAAMAVLLYHAGLDLAFPAGSSGVKILSFSGAGGQLGVRFFFMLSGYLITYRMLVERERTGRFSIGRFYLRRVLRIWPLYYASLLLGFFVLPWIMGFFGRGFNEVSSPLLYVFFLADHDFILNSPQAIGMLGVQWTVSLEEQFYLLWPLLFLLVRKRWQFALAIVLAIVAAEWWIRDSSLHMKVFHLFANLRFLGVGALLSLLVFARGEWIDDALRRIPGWLRTAALFSGPVALFWMYTWALDYPTRLTIANNCALLFFSYVLVDRSFAHGFQLARIPGLGWIGERSYGIYLLHMFALELARGVFNDDPSLILCSILFTVVLTLLISHLSYRYFETPFLRLKERFA